MMKKNTPRLTYRHSDLQRLKASCDANFVMNNIMKERSRDISLTEKAYMQLAYANDVPPSLRHYYEKVARKIKEVDIRLGQLMDLTQYEGESLCRRIDSFLGDMKLTVEDLNRLRHINNRLLELEKLLKQILEGMLKQQEKLEASGAEWMWLFPSVSLTLKVGCDTERPSYGHRGMFENLLFEPLEIRTSVELKEIRDAREDEMPWSLLGRDMIGGEVLGSNEHVNFDLIGQRQTLDNISACYLYYKVLLSHLGLWGMLHLRSIVIEINPSPCGRFDI